MTRDRNIDELAAIEFQGSLSTAFLLYSRELYALARRWQFELDMAASDSKAAMESLQGHPLLFGLDAKVKARRVSKRLRRAQSLAHGLAEEAMKFDRSYRNHFLASGYAAPSPGGRSAANGASSGGASANGASGSHPQAKYHWSN